MKNYPSIEPPIDNPPEPLCMGDGPYRPNVAALILRPGRNEPEILLGERRDTPGCWQWPQGGLDPGEDPETGLRREVEEEIGVTNLKILYRFPFLLRYRFPERLYQRFRPNLGQEQYYYAAVLADGEEPDLAKASDKEFNAIRWSPLSDANQEVIWFKAAVYRAALEHLYTILHRLDIP